MSETTKCSAPVNRNGGNSRWPNWEDCGRPAIEDGLCKLHLRVKAQRAKRDEEFRAKWDYGAALEAEADALSKKLGIKVGLDYNPYGSGGGGYTGRFVVPGDWLRSQA